MHLEGSKNGRAEVAVYNLQERLGFPSKGHIELQREVEMREVKSADYIHTVCLFV